MLWNQNIAYLQKVLRVKKGKTGSKNCQIGSNWVKEGNKRVMIRASEVWWLHGASMVAAWQPLDGSTMPPQRLRSISMVAPQWLCCSRNICYEMEDICHRNVVNKELYVILQETWILLYWNRFLLNKRYFFQIPCSICTSSSWIRMPCKRPFHAFRDHFIAKPPKTTTLIPLW